MADQPDPDTKGPPNAPKPNDKPPDQSYDPSSDGGRFEIQPNTYDKTGALPSDILAKRSSARKKVVKKKSPSGQTNSSDSLSNQANQNTADTAGPTQTKPAQDQYPTGPGGSTNGANGPPTSTPSFTPTSTPTPTPTTQPSVPPNSGTNKSTQPNNAPPNPDPTRGTPTGLTVKSGAIRGPAAAGTYALGHAIQDSIPGFNRFTAFNDEYHQGTNSFHAKGLALDFTVNSGAAGSQAAANAVSRLLSQNGIRGTIINEYLHPSARATGGHIHVNYASYADAAKGAQVFGAAGSNNNLIAGSGPFDPKGVQSGAVSMSDRVSLALAAGFTSAEAATMGAISQAESSGNSNAHNTNASTGDNSYGLWQINMIGNLGPARDALFRQNIPGYTGYESLKNPWINAQAARLIYNQQGFRAWSTYTNGSYGKYTNDALNGIGAGSETAGTGNATGSGQYPSSSSGLNVNGTTGSGGSNNPYAGGQPQLGIFSLAQFLQQNVGGFQSVSSFTNPPSNSSNPSAYSNGLALDFKINNPTTNLAEQDTQYIKNFLNANNISGTVTDFYLTSSPITAGYIHIELANKSAADQLSVYLANLSDFNATVANTTVVNGN